MPLACPWIRIATGSQVYATRQWTRPSRQAVPGWLHYDGMSARIGSAGRTERTPRRLSTFISQQWVAEPVPALFPPRSVRLGRWEFAGGAGDRRSSEAREWRDGRGGPMREKFYPCARRRDRAAAGGIFFPLARPLKEPRSKFGRHCGHLHKAPAPGQENKTFFLTYSRSLSRGIEIHQ